MGALGRARGRGPLIFRRSFLRPGIRIRCAGAEPYRELGHMYARMVMHVLM